MSRFADVRRGKLRAWVLLAAAACGGGSSGGTPPAADGPAQIDAAATAGPDAGPDAAAPGETAAPDAAPDTAPEAAAGICDDYAARWCARFGTCSPVLLLALFEDAAGCAERAKVRCAAEVGGPGSGFTAAAASCLPALEAASCTDLLGDTVAGCKLAGALAAGAACGSGGQCASGFCRLPETSFCGQCAAPAAEGATCESSAGCQFPLRCSRAGRCTKAGDEGAFCNETRPCRPTLYCSDADNTCRRYAAKGEPCNVEGPTFIRPCDDGLYCRRGPTSVCTAIKYVGAGERCAIPMSSMAGAVTLCRGSASCLEGTCVPPGKDGERCTPSPLGDSTGCLPPALCLEGRCKVPDPAECR
jgi:hypothetical protein